MARVSSTYGGYLNVEKVTDAGLVGKTMDILETGPAKFDDGKRSIVVVIAEEGDEDNTYDLSLNVTNAGSLAEAFGDESNDWPGKQLTLKIEPTNMGKKKTKGIRVYPVKPLKADKVGE
jgi:hypothetical protein